MSHKKTKICDKTGKSILSEAQASRKVTQYNDITRYYYCEYCFAYHLTSKTKYQTFDILRELLKQRGIYRGRKKMEAAIKTFDNWSCAISERPGKCLGRLDDFIEHYLGTVCK